MTKINAIHLGTNGLIAVNPNSVPAIRLEIKHNTVMWNEGFDQAGTWKKVFVASQAEADHVKRLVQNWSDSQSWSRRFWVKQIKQPVLVDPSKIKSGQNLMMRLSKS